VPYALKVQAGDSIRLADIDPSDHDGLEKEESKAKFAELAEEVAELQELMFAARQTGLLIVFQGRDTAGKDGAINRVLEYVNVQSCRVAGFKAPTSEELAHDFLWRVHPHAPAKGGISIFNRSHYEDVIAVRVHDLAPKEVWKKRYDQINAFEELLTASNTIVLKFFLHISKEEQEKRLLEREQDPEKAWKLNVGDWKEREFWKETTEAYEEVFERCSTNRAPWRIIPANHKWFRDLAVVEALRDTLRPYKKDWKESLDELGVSAKQALIEYRKSME
jgi:PPK2 family polyphosphate:nucleotide phosphotransferase